METTIIIEGVIPGLNGSNGLMQQHYRKAMAQKKIYQAIIRSQTKNKHLGQVSIDYIGYKSVLMDWDNFCASFKHIGDSLVECGVIVDDNPKIVRPFRVQQIKCKRIDQRVEIVIRDLESKFPTKND
jgi:hypothetical protein